jgi:hypothetical protein
MLTVRTRMLLAALAAFAVSPSALAQAKAKTTKTYSSTIQSTTLSTGNGYPNPGGTVVLAGAWSTNTFGAGALVDHTTIMGRRASNVFTFMGSETDFLGLGSLSSMITGTDTVQSTGVQQISVQGRVIGGTGRYLRAAGHFTFSGTIEAGSMVLNGHSSGSITY